MGPGYVINCLNLAVDIKLDSDVMIDDESDDIYDGNADGEPLTPADHGKVPGNGKTVVPVPAMGSG